MKLIKKISQHRRDFEGEYQCENCGEIETYHACYDDRNFHDNVTPRWKCKKCGKTSLDMKDKPDHVPTKYSDLEVV